MTEPTATSEVVVTPKRAVRRKPLWLLIPVEFDEIESADTDNPDVIVTTMKPTRFVIERCTSKKAVLKTLEKYKVDPHRPEQMEHLILLRADPIEFELSQQVLLKY